MSSLRYEIAMRWTIVVPGKYVTEDIMLVLKEVEIGEEAIPVHIHQGKTRTKPIIWMRTL